MGLDITGYSHMQPLPPEHEHTDDCYDAGHVRAYVYAVFSDSYRGLRELRRTELPRDDLWIVEGGCYEPTEKTEQIRFRAGSYGGYNRWRRELADQFNPYGTDRGMDPYGCERDVDTAPDPKGRFYELIWFADNEGSIGPDAARDLLEDFRDCREAYMVEHAGPGNETGYRRELYDQWLRAFELAADGGLVRFH